MPTAYLLVPPRRGRRGPPVLLAARERFSNEPSRAANLSTRLACDPAGIVRVRELRTIHSRRLFSTENLCCDTGVSNLGDFVPRETRTERCLLLMYSDSTLLRCKFIATTFATSRVNVYYKLIALRNKHCITVIKFPTQGNPCERLSSVSTTMNL